jgi:hypothetical protein
MNNLYGKAMMYPMPIGDYEEIHPDDMSVEDILKYDYENSHVGYFILCDIHCPEEIHDKVMAYPLFPEKIDGKLEATLTDKTNYLVHIAYLRLGLMLGYELKKIHKIIKFRQECFMKSYIELNTSKRIEASKNKNKTLEDFYKLMNNSIYGKTCENPLRYKNYVFLTDKNEKIKFINSPKCRDFHKINDHVLLGVSLNKVRYLKPITIGFTVLEISKLIMGQFYYKVLQPRFQKNMRLLYTDTDSLFLYFKWHRDPMTDFWEMKEHFELENHNVKIPGKMKIEYKCLFFGSFAPKCYTYVRSDGFVKTKIKGIPEHLLKEKSGKNLKEIIQEIQKRFDNVEEQKFTFNHFKSSKHQVKLVEDKRTIKKISTKRIRIGTEIYPKGYILDKKEKLPANK